MRRLTLLLCVPLLALFVLAAPSTADHCEPGGIYIDPETGKVRLCEHERPPPPDDEGGGEEPGPEPDCGPWLPYEPPAEREDGASWQEEMRGCSLDGEDWWEYRTVCVANCPGGPDAEETFDELLRIAVAQADPPLPGMRTSFDQPAHDGEVRAIVNAESWWWAESTAPIAEYDEDGPMWVRVTASAERMEVDPGDGSDPIVALPPHHPAFDAEADCPLPGLAYNRNQSYYDQVPGKERGACVHVYEETADEVTATMTVTWTVTYEGFLPGAGPGNPNVSGTVGPQEREQTLSFPVKEIQSVIVR